jgi:hypothetical protein
MPRQLLLYRISTFHNSATTKKSSLPTEFDANAGSFYPSGM